MSSLAPEVSVLALALGLVFALGCYLVTNLSPGGMITPGWLALVLIAAPRLAFIIAGVAVVTYFASRALQRVVILYGKRLFATVVLVGVFLQMTVLVFVTSLRDSTDYTTLGFIIPGLVAYQLIRQPVVATLTATAAVASMAYLIVLAGVELRLIEGSHAGPVAARGTFAAPEIHAGRLQVAFVVGAFILGLFALARTLRRVERPGRTPGGADASP